MESENNTASEFAKKGLLAAMIVEKRKIETNYAHCVLPENFFDFGTSRGERETQLLSIESWDGRQIMTVERKGY